MPALFGALTLVACRCGSPSSGEDRAEVEREAPGESGQPAAAEEPHDGESEEIAYLDGAALLASYDTTALARFGQRLPKPTPTPSPLVGVFGSIVDQLLGDPSDRLEHLGLAQNARIRLSLRALDGRAAAVRKLLRELEGGAAAEPERVADMRSQAASLGVHLRATLPARKPARLLKVLELVARVEGDAEAWSATCASLEGAKLCTGQDRLLVWVRAPADQPDRLRVDAIYWFYDGAEARDLERAALRADGWAGGEAAPLDEGADLAMAILAEPSLALLQTEALADAARDFAEGELDYAEFLNRERALAELAPDERIFAGLGLDLAVEDDRLIVDMGWLPAAFEGPEGLFAPVVGPRPYPTPKTLCAEAEVCGRAGGLDIAPRFAPLATAGYADPTTLSRVLRQAGDRGLILVGLVGWPHLLGTFGAKAKRDARGITDRAISALVRDSHGLGFAIHELGERDPEDRWIAYLRLGPEAFAALHSAAGLSPLGLSATQIPGVEGSVEAGSFSDESETMRIYFVDERELDGGLGGWVLAADGPSRVPWLLDLPSEQVGEARGEPDPLWYLRVEALGPLSAREGVPFADDPPVQTWLRGQTLELVGNFSPEGPRVRVSLIEN